ncbi:MAG: XisI protein [Cyanobacteria bacterium P01_F01_bin.150]
MDKRVEYRQAIQNILCEYHQINQKSRSEVESCLMFDEERDHYLLMLMGWKQDERIKSAMIHIRIKDEKIWVEEDWTEDGIATELMQRGIKSQDIVLAFHPPHVRQYTEFAIA